MNLRPIKENMTELHLNDLPTHGTVILFSYSTPVAAYTPNDGWIRTNKFWSRTTSRHINHWMGRTGKEVNQDYLDRLVK